MLVVGLSLDLADARSVGMLSTYSAQLHYTNHIDSLPSWSIDGKHNENSLYLLRLGSVHRTSVYSAE